LSCLAVTIAALADAGCGPKPTVAMPSQSIEVQGLDEARKRIQADPMAFLRETLTRTRELRYFTAHFQRQERLRFGLLSELKPLENIFAEYRDERFSVRFTWEDENSEYLQCVYVEGRHDNKILLLPRRGWFGLPPSVGRYAPEMGVIWGKTRNPITDFGPRRMMERTLARIEKAGRQGEVAIKLLPPTEIGPAKEPCFHLELRYPPSDEFSNKLQDLYIHTQSLLPVATYLWLPGKPERTEATLDALYTYGQLNTHVVLTDAHFRIDADQGKPAARPKTGSANDGGTQAPGSETALSNRQGNQ
jgi:hypothetical protein